MIFIIFEPFWSFFITSIILITFHKYASVSIICHNCQSFPTIFIKYHNLSPLATFFITFIISQYHSGLFMNFIFSHQFSILRHILILSLYRLSVVSIIFHHLHLRCLQVWGRAAACPNPQPCRLAVTKKHHVVTLSAARDGYADRFVCKWGGVGVPPEPPPALFQGRPCCTMVHHFGSFQHQNCSSFGMLLEICSSYIHHVSSFPIVLQQFP